MEAPENIKNTIANVLALADNPNEHEARAALLKARELMAKYMLREEGIKRTDNVTVIRRLIGITCTKMTDTWAVRLSGIIAEHYCCKGYTTHRSREKKVSIGIVGLEDDFAICERVFKFAYDCVVTQCKRIRKQYRDTLTASTIRQMENAYGFGFCDGILTAYKEQTAKNQEFGLVLVTPQVVVDAMTDMGKGKPYVKVKYDDWSLEFAKKGYQDGMQFDPSTKLPGDSADE